MDASREPRDDASSLLLTLPPELRNNIYGYVTKDQSFVDRKKKRLVSTRAAASLASANKQLNDEVEAYIHRYTLTVTATVRKLNFSTLIYVLNRLPTEYIASLPKKGRSCNRKFIVHMTNTSTERPNLSRWINRFADPSRRGIDIDFTYTVSRKDSESRMFLWDRQVIHERWYAELLEKCELAKVVELDKVLDALKVYKRT